MKTIFITSNEPWGDVWFSKHHYANELACLGHQVYFINPQLKWSPLNLFSFSVNLTRHHNGLIVVDFKNNFPVLHPIFLLFNDVLNSWKVRKMVESAQNVIWWQFDPFRFIDIFFFKKSKRIYHVVDPYQHLKTDSIIAKKADLIVLVSKCYTTYYPINKQIYIPHGFPCTSSSVSRSEVVRSKRKIILYIGTLNADVDFILLRAVADRFTEQNLVLIGPNGANIEQKGQLLELINMPNVMYLGAIPNNEISAHCEDASVCLVPYLPSVSRKIHSHRTPLKINSYLLAKKPIVTTESFDFQELVNKAIFHEETHAGFLDRIESLLHVETINVSSIVEPYIRERRYPLLIERIFKKLNK